MSDNLLDAAHDITMWLNQTNPLTREEQGLRIMKLCEEAGEAAQAWIGYVGQNPRKGHTHTIDDVIAELVDVMLTAAVAIDSLDIDVREVVDSALAKTLCRIEPS